MIEETSSRADRRFVIAASSSWLAADSLFLLSHKVLSDAVGGAAFEGCKNRVTCR